MKKLIILLCLFAGIAKGQIVGGFVPSTRILTINGTSYNLSANRTWSLTPTGIGAWGVVGNALGNNTSILGSTDNRSFKLFTNNTYRVKFDSIGNNTIHGSLAINGNSLTTNWYLETDPTGNTLSAVINSGSLTNSYLGIQGINNNILEFKNLTTGVKWRWGNSSLAVVAGLDAYYLGTSNNPDLAFFSLGTDGYGRFLNRVRIGSLLASSAVLHLGAGSASLPAIRLTSGALPTGTNIVAGNIAFLTDKMYFTRTTSTVVVEFEQTLSTTATLDFPSTIAQTVSSLTVALTNAADGDPIEVGVPAASSSTTNAQWVGRVTTAGVVTIYFQNNNLATTIDPASGSYVILAKKNR